MVAPLSKGINFTMLSLFRRKRHTFATLLFLWIGCALPLAHARHAVDHIPPRQTLVVAVYAPLDDLIRSVIPRWKQLHPDVDLRVLTRAFEEHHSVTFSALNTASHVPDVLVVEVSRLGRFAATDKLEPLGQAPYFAAKLQGQFVPYAMAQAHNSAGNIVALPADVGPATMLYRADVLARAGVDVQALTQSWESFLQAGVKLRQTTGFALVAHARNVADVLMQANLREGEGVFFDRQGKPLVQSDRFVRAFETARRVRQLGLDASLTSFTPDWSRGVRENKVATLLSGSWMAGHLATWLAPEQKGLWRAAQLPEQTWSFSGGSFYAIPRTGKNKELAWDLVQLMTLDREVQWAAFKVHHSFPALLSAHADSFVGAQVEYLGNQRARTLWREATRHVQSAVVSERELEARSVVHTELEKVLTQDKNVHTALRDAHAILVRWAGRP